MTRRPGIDEAFVHPALFYRTEEEYTAQTVSFVREGLASDEPVAVAVPGRNLDLIRAGLGADADAVSFLDMAEAGRNPGRIISQVLRKFADSHPRRRVRIIGEPIWADRSAMEYPACAQHEALINPAFENRAATILCPYDEARLDADILADARLTHPTVISRGREQDSDAYDWRAAVARFNEPLSPAPTAAEFAFAAPKHSAARRFAVGQARQLGLVGQRLLDVELAVAELTTNSVMHGGGSGTLAVWAEAGQFRCEVRDRGRLADPLAGRRPPEAGQIGGRGLLLVHNVADLVRVHTGDDGTTVRIHFDR
ncbi:anti-sigma factor RsbA family regulatory protein [Yinghuangia sp. YIM S10712]|uniref:anti-sigma factor RsbA family regulatory protein n=1 Tax=Yinghuangia sp. YIM S10712 TaxID=3436930 RepID=UPI003F535613